MKMITRKQWLVLLAVAFLISTLTACRFLDRYLDAGQTDSAAATEAGLFSGVEGIKCIPDISNYEEATLIHVLDGDSIKVNIDGQEYQVRYIGIDTPEYNSDQRAFAIQATEANRKLIQGQKLYLFKDQTETDKFDRLLRFVVANGQFVNLELVRSGHARSKWYTPDISCNPTFDLAVVGIK